MQTTEKTLKEIYKTGNKETREKLEAEFPTIFQTKTELEKAINYLSEKDEEVIKLRKFEKILDENDRTLAEQRLIVYIKFKNEKYIFTESDCKYRIWWNLYSFCFDDVFFSRANTNLPLALCFKNEKDATSVKDNQEILGYFKTYYL